MEDALDLVRKRWKAAIMLELAGGGLRYGELYERLPSVSYKVLTEVLRELEADGLLSRTQLTTRPKHVCYELTAAGLQLVPILAALEKWSGQDD